MAHQEDMQKNTKIEVETHKEVEETNNEDLEEQWVTTQAEAEVETMEVQEQTEVETMEVNEDQAEQVEQAEVERNRRAAKKRMSSFEQCDSPTKKAKRKG